MEYNLELAEKVRAAVAEQPTLKELPKMGGLSFMINDKLCVRVQGEDLMLRCDPEQTEELLLKDGARRYEMNGKTMMKGWLLIGPEGTTNQQDFEYWINIALNYNKKLIPKKKAKRLVRK